MFQSSLRYTPLVFIIVISLGFVAFALAHETDDAAHMEEHAQADASVGVQTGQNPLKPLDLIRAAKESVKQGAGAKMPLQNASSGPNQRAMKGDVAKERAAGAGELMRKVKDAVRQHAGLIKERFALALRQFDKLTARIEARLEKMKAEGIATASVEAELALAKSQNAEAKADVQAVADFVASVDENADRAQVRTQLQTHIKEAQTSIREAHQALQKTVRSLVALAKENRPQGNASASVEAEAGVEASNE